LCAQAHAFRFAAAGFGAMPLPGRDRQSEHQSSGEARQFFRLWCSFRETLKAMQRYMDRGKDTSGGEEVKPFYVSVLPVLSFSPVRINFS
jgi:hypothetical protein